MVVGVEPGYRNMTTEWCRDALVGKDAELRTQYKQIAKLRKALEPFAVVVDWISECQKHDRNAKFFGLTLHIDTGASGFGLTFKKEQFEAAHAALKD